MSRILGWMFAGLLLTPLPAAAGDLTLRDVMELHRSGLGDDLLMAVIDADGGPFRLSFVDIQDLKGDGLSERVIAALVRTGAGQSINDGAADVTVDAVGVYPEVVAYVPSIVVVGIPVVPLSREESHRGHAPHQVDRPLRSQPPPATWVTRRQDGRNVSASRPARPPAPAATWVTPRDPQSGERQASDAVRPTPR
jgi:hypothetical protein